jgi:hypothetical protein
MHAIHTYTYIHTCMHAYVYRGITAKSEGRLFLSRKVDPLRWGSGGFIELPSQLEILAKVAPPGSRSRVCNACVCVCVYVWFEFSSRLYMCTPIVYVCICSLSLPMGLSTHACICVAATSSLLQLWIREDMEGRMRESVMSSLADKDVREGQESANTKETSHLRTYASRLPPAEEVVNGFTRGQLQRVLRCVRACLYVSSYNREYRHMHICNRLPPAEHVVAAY